MKLKRKNSEDKTHCFEGCLGLIIGLSVMGMIVFLCIGVGVYALFYVLTEQEYWDDYGPKIIAEQTATLELDEAETRFLQATNRILSVFDGAIFGQEITRIVDKSVYFDCKRFRASITYQTDALYHDVSREFTNLLSEMKWSRIREFAYRGRFNKTIIYIDLEELNSDNQPAASSSLTSYKIHLRYSEPSEKGCS